jgi:hypothetical protein
VGGRLQGLKRKKLFYTIREMGSVSSSLRATTVDAFVDMFGDGDRLKGEENLDGLAGFAGNLREAFLKSEKVVSSAADLAVLNN